MKRLVLFISLFLFLQTAKSQTSYTWNGSVSTAWNTPANWTPNGIPGAADNVKIVTAGNSCLLNTSTHLTNITLTSGTLDLGGFTLTVDGATAAFNAGAIQNGALTITGATTTTFGNGPVTMNCPVTITSAAITLKNTTFQNSLTLTKTGSTNDNSGGGNIFNGAVTMTNTGIGYLLLANGSPDQFNAAATFNNTGGSNIYVAYNSTNNIFGGVTSFNNAPTGNTGIYVGQNSAGTLFNDNMVVSSTSGLGVFFGGGATATINLSATKTIGIGAAGFSAGTLSLRQFTQVGATAQNLALTGAGALTLGPSSSFNGNLTTSSPSLSLTGTTFNGTTDLTKTGATGDWSSGNNVFNGVCSITNSGTSYLVLGNSNPDIWNNDVTFTDNGSERLLPCWASVGNQFNGNIYVNTSGSATGVQFCGGNATATATLATGKTIQAGAGGLTAGYLYLKQFTQAGNTPVNITATGTAALYLGPGSNFGGAFTATAPDIWAQGATYNSPASFIKTGGGNNHNNQYQNIFNSTCSINQQSSTGYFMLGYNSNDLFMDNITVTSTGTGGIYLGWTSGTGTPTLSAGKTIFVGAGGFSAGFLYLNTFTQLGNTPINLSFTGTNTYLAFARSSVIGGNLTTNTPDIYFNGSTFNGLVNTTKTGAGNDYGTGSNIFQGSTILNNTGAGYLILGNNNADTWNSDVTFNSTGSSFIGPAWNSAGNTFNGNITVNSTGSSTGIQFCNASTATATLAAGYAIQTGAAGFTTGILYLRRFTQLGNTAINLNLTGATTLLQVGPSSAIGGAFTAVSPRILLNGAVYSDVVTVTKTGITGEWSSGGNTFNSTLTVNQLGGGYFGFASGAPDIYNGDVYANNNSTERIIFGNNPTGNQFNGNIILTQTGSSVGIAFGWSSTTDETQAAGKTISIGAAGFTTGYLQIERFTQLGNTPMNLPLTGNSSLTFGPTSTIGGNLSSTSGSLYFNGCTFNGTVNATKTGSTNDYSSGNNIFNDVSVMTDAGSGFLVLGNGNRDQFMSAATFNNTGSNNLYVAYNSANNIFGGVTTFNNTPTGNMGIFVSSNSAGTLFSDNILVTSTSGQGVQFCSGNNTATATLAAGKTIAIGSGGFSAGTLLLRQFTQTGATAQSLTLTGTGNLTFGPSSAFGGDVTTVSPTLYFNGCNFSGTVTSAKNGGTSDASSGNNTFNGAFAITNTGAGYFLMGNGSPDLWQSTAAFNNLSAGNHLYVAYNSTGNIFNGDVLFNNQPAAGNLWIYPNAYGINTQFNGNITVANVNGGGVYFGSSTGTAVLASGKTVSVGAGGFNTGGLIFRNFRQTGPGTAQNLTMTGAGYIQYGNNASFDGPVTSSSPGLFFNGCVFNSTVNCTKTGSANDQSQGNNIFNGAGVFTNTGTGYLLMTNTTPDAYNSDVTFVQSNTGSVYPNYNGNSIYAGNLTITSPSATAITFGAGNGTATLSGSGAQSISATGGTAVPVFTRLVVNNGNGVTLNTPVNVSVNLTLTAGLLNTTTTNILTMLSGSAVAAGDALSTSYINGPMRYKKSSSGVSTLNFPIGKGADCRPVILTVNHTTGNTYYYQAQLFDASAAALGYTLPPSVDVVSGEHYYTIGRTNATNVTQPTLELSGNQQIQVFFGANDVATNGSTLTVVKNTYLNPTKWIDIGGLGGPVYNAGANLTGSITSTSAPTAFNSFSTFALGDKMGGGNVLPVGLLHFSAQPDNDRVNLSWTTSTETNNNYFTIEKSSDGIHFNVVGTVPSQALGGNSSIPLDYTAQDPAPYAGVSFYRLKQTDLDGQSTYSAIMPVSFTKKKTVAVYPNPTTGILHVTGISATETSLKVEWFDLSGKSLLQGTVPVQNGFATLNAPASINNGMYTLRFTASDGSITLQNVILLK
ncbi:MAG TPA: T9SS type A sorting domain-containing protein [Puia sp.]